MFSINTLIIGSTYLVNSLKVGVNPSLDIWVSKQVFPYRKI